MPPTLVMPFHTSGARHASAMASRSRGMRSRQSSPKRDAAPAGAVPPAVGVALSAAVVNTRCEPADVVEQIAERIVRTRCLRVELIVTHVAYELTELPGGRFEVGGHAALLS